MRRISAPRVYLAPPNDSPYGAGPPPSPPAPAIADPGPGLPVAPPAPASVAAPNGDPAPAPAPAPSLDSSVLQSAIETALGPIQAELASIRASQVLAEPQAPVGDDDFTQSFLNDPQSAVTGVVKEVVGQLAPFLNELSGTAHDGIIEGHRATIDAEFGPGAFQEEFMPILGKRFETARRENPTLLASREWINSEINGVKGFKMNSLVDRRGAAAAARTEAEKTEAERMLSQFNTTNLTGGARPSASKSREPTEAEQAYLESRAKGGGQSVDLQTLRKSQDGGSSLSELRTALAVEKD